MKHKASSTPEDIAIDPVTGARKGGRRRFSGQYPRWLSAKLKAEPELREQYQRKADRMNSIHDSGCEDETVVGTGSTDPRSQQKRL